VIKGETYMPDLDDRETRNVILHILDKKKDLRTE
jgi:hypothetical protein